jgi:hypothetical protein
VEKAVKVFRWLLFTVLFGLCPLLVRYINSRANEKPMNLMETLNNGDLFIVGAVIAADAIGKAFHGNTKQQPDAPWRRLMRIVCGFGCVALLFAASIEFSQVASRIESKATYNAGNIASDSLWMFGWIVAAGLGVILVVED